LFFKAVQVFRTLYQFSTFNPTVDRLTRCVDFDAEARLSCLTRCSSSHRAIFVNQWGMPLIAGFALQPVTQIGA